MHTETKLWSLRYSHARGAYWLCERSCVVDNADTWLRVFQKDEPNTLFVVSSKRPTLKRVDASKATFVMRM